MLTSGTSMKQSSDRGQNSKMPWNENEGLTAEQRCRQLLLRELDDWRWRQKDLPSRPEAIRRLLGQALRSEGCDR